MAGNDSDWAPASARPLDDDWKPASARPLDEPPAVDIGPKEAFFRGAGQGVTLGFGDEINAGLQAFGQKVFRSGLEPGEKAKDFGDYYREARDSFRRENEDAQRAHPWGYLGGSLVGGLASTAPVAGLGGGLEGWKALAALSGTGAALGAAQGLGDSDADLTGIEALKAIGKGGAIGAFAPVVFKGAGAIGKKTFSAVADAMDRGAVSVGRRALSGGTTLADAGKKALSDEAVRQALEEGAIRAGGTTRGAANRLNALREAGGQALGGIESDLDRAGFIAPGPRGFRDELAAKASDLESVLGEGAPAYRRAAGKLSKLIPPEPAPRPDFISIPEEQLRDMSHDDVVQLLNSVGGRGEPAADSMPIQQAIGMKRSLQDAADAEYKKLGTTPLGEAKMDIAATARKRLVDAIQQQSSKDPEAAAQYVLANQRLSKLIEASNFANRGANQAAKRHFFSLMDIAPTLTGGGIGAMSGHGGEAAGLAALAAVGSHLARTRGPSTLAAALYNGQAVPRGIEALADLAGSKFNLGRILPLTLAHQPFATMRGLPQLSSGDE